MATANNNVYAQIAEQQNQTLLNTGLRSQIGVDSNQIGKLLNDANRLIQTNAIKYKERNNAQTIEELDTTKRDELLVKGQQLVDEIPQQINNYEASLIYLNKMNELEGKYARESDKLLSSVDGIVSTMQTNSRRVDYQTPEVERLNTIRIILMIFFYVLLLFYIFRQNIIEEVMRKNYRVIVFLIVCAFFPLFADTFVQYIFSLVHDISLFFSNRVPRDVYVKV